MPKKILLIDDDQTNVKVIESRLKKEGFTVFTAADGQEGLALIQPENPDLILLDIEMPNMNGYTFMLEFQKMEEFSDIPVIVQTAYAEMQPVFKLNRVKDFVVKPLNINALIEKINKFIR